MTRNGMGRLHDKHSERVRELLSQYANEDPGPDPIEDVLESSSATSSGSFEVGAPSYLSLRISGESIRSGSIDTELFDDVVVPFQAEIRAAGSQKSFTRLELVSITAGSSVLHFRPRLLSVDDGDASIDEMRLTTLWGPIDQVLDVHDAIESLTTPRDTRSSLLDGLSRLTSGLNKHNAELDVLWRPGSGRLRPSRLGHRGLDYARDLFERSELVEVIEVSGYIYAMSLPGEVTLKQNTQRKNSSTYRVQVSDPRATLAQLSLYSFVRMRVREKSTVDQFGRAIDKSYELVSVLEHQMQLPFDEDPGS